MPEAKTEAPKTRKLRKIRQGLIVSDKMDRSIVVKIERTVRHPLYKKVMKRSKKYIAHDQENTGKVGDLVRITECRPISRHKKWRLLEVVSKARV